MKINNVHIKGRFKNLEDFHFDFGENSMETVLLGLNATGKSNFMEAIVIIFRDLDLERAPILHKQSQSFEYIINYTCRDKSIEVDYSEKKGYIFSIDGEKLKSKTQFFKNKNEYLPSHVFVYYSGLSERLRSLYADHKVQQFKKMMDPTSKYEDFKEMPRIFLVEPIHASFALIAFYLFDEREKETIDFLKKELNIVDFGSALFMLKQPNWSKSRKDPDHFWNTAGLVRRFIEDLWNFSIVPMFYKETVRGALNKRETLNRLFLFLKDKEAIRAFVEMKYENKITLFNALCSLHYSELVEDQDVRIKVLKEHVEGELAMGELSEGEKQLITVLGLLKFTKDDEALILLDEPDTHLNPLWKWKYLEFLENVVSKSAKTQIVFCTHDPLVIGGMEKEQVRVFKRDADYNTEVTEPDVSPKGLGVAGILTSPLFGLPTILDKKTQEKLNRKRYLQGRLMREKLNKAEYDEYQKLKADLEDYGFYEEVEDKWFKAYLAEMSKLEAFGKTELTESEKQLLADESTKAAERVLKLIQKDGLS
ncbi:AAA family ATPase [Flavobacterium aquidurense]|uniref:ABC-type cobalamin/Fe3+-siderophores transport system ATPase subunit n=2 Tax=Flavobacterium TaxID=237 RepID=A0A7W7IX01_9FLAO|nr:MULTISPECIES: AAA family ATPase [Flavobacterium]MBB4801687.1 ABC-type cobalamin/Fe3+-siderophores transport system ATPase subunit [Flavobacterium nitrogenifigens]MBB6386645.1 ABC-type cobalamin/Fe3+-siderophores transport system ATPase subunit [Flavobacterium notoginsengisoli]